MKFQEIKELIEIIQASNLAEFKMKEGEFELSNRTDKYEKHKSYSPLLSAPPQVFPVPQGQQPYLPTNNMSASPSKVQPDKEAASTVTDEDNGKSEEDFVTIKSPIVGTFYRSQSPEKPPYIKVGDTVEVGMVVCIVEAMKLFNEIESEIQGKVVKVLVEDAQPVEYDQPLFLVDPQG